MFTKTKEAKMRIGFWGLILIQLALPSIVQGQCQERVVLSDSTYLVCEGVLYNNCIVDLKVDSAGFWLNEELAVPFKPAIDSIPESTKAFLRTTQPYIQEIQAGATERDALNFARKYKQQAIMRIRELNEEVFSPEDLNKVKDSLLADPQIVEYVSDLKWQAETNSVSYKARETERWVHKPRLVITSCWEPSYDLYNWEEYLAYLMEDHCVSVQRAKELEAPTQPGRFRAVRLGSGYGYMSNTSREKLLEGLKR